MTGVQLMQAIHADRPELPVIIATGYAEMPGDIRVSKLSKPFTEKELARALKAVLG
jgi:FixJ family two-component response regulator